ncbi:MAG: exodeoxyribonuclease V subunit alpha, partial [Gammaproteobacteria bacterium]|nr:exodeoxyribonuclease V subunit alpha [Gammaproteobacteria bacterium]
SAQLAQSAIVGQPEEFTPLILDKQNRLYLYRYWDYERRLAVEIRHRLTDVVAEIDLGKLKQSLTSLFPSALEETNWQKIAASMAYLKPLCIISGGPGTGKTSTVVRILALLQSQTETPLRIALAAPTGKAAARMSEAILAAKSKLGLDSDVMASIPEEAFTLHRLLGVRQGRTKFIHRGDNPLPIDLLVIDEASMVDLALLCKTLEALPAKARLILLGDRDQLSSVEAGSVLGDLCSDQEGFSAPFCRQLEEVCEVKIDAQEQKPSEQSLADSVVLLQHSYRFGADSGIGQLARAVNQGHSAQAMMLLRQTECADIEWCELNAGAEVQLEQRLYEGFLPLFEAKSVEEAFAAFADFRLLCVNRKGKLGVEAMNRLVESLLLRQKKISAESEWYRGRPIMITRNNYELKLFNGDVGIAWPDPNKGGAVQLFFIGADGELRSFSPSRLPEFETVYAMTIHKSQGSEFERLVMLLPSVESPLLSRELIYTGLTRAKASVQLWGSERVFKRAVEQRVQRASGLLDQLIALN